MENLIVELSKYLIIILFAMYTFYCFSVFRQAGLKEEQSGKKRQRRIFFVQRILMVSIHLICYLVLYLNTKELSVLALYGAELCFLLAAVLVYQAVYKNLSKLVLNNMLMLLVVSFIMLTRLSFPLAVKQFVFAAASLAVCLIVPFVIEKFSWLKRPGWLYGGVGIAVLLAVLLFAEEKYGAKNWLVLFGFGIQPSEFVKILFIFFVASLLSKRRDFKYVVLVSAVAGGHILLLVLEKDLGGALIFFMTYLFMLYVATRQPLYLFAGLLGGSGAAALAYRLFDHVKTRVTAWRDPWTDIEHGGYQIAQSLFAVGTGGWFGLGLGQGLPQSIPVRESDFIFPAISEELGGVFAVCIILVSISCFLMFINISMKMKNTFYKLTAFGLSIQYIFQVFLNIGGVTKFIPSTGVTLPLISYGGSSMVSVIMIFSIIQGLYVLNQNEDVRNEREKTKKASGKKRAASPQDI